MEEPGSLEHCVTLESLYGLDEIHEPSGSIFIRGVFPGLQFHSSYILWFRLVDDSLYSFPRSVAPFDHTCRLANVSYNLVPKSH